MKYSVIVEPHAAADMQGIYRYIANELLEPQTAKNLLERIEKSILGLDSLPFRFKKYDPEPWRSRGVHSMPVENFVVLYVPSKEKREVYVIRVFYGGMDIDEQMNK